MDWFERLTGFREDTYHWTRQQFEVAGGRLLVRANGRSWRVGDFALKSLRALRDEVAAQDGPPGRPFVRSMVGDVAELHQEGEFEGALFQVASQFNCLEMTSPGVTPEDGVGRYGFDVTQGPACAIAAGAATIWRNYFAPVGGGEGQTRDRQIDGLAGVGALLARGLGRPVESLWAMSNGYALGHHEGLMAIAAHLQFIGEAGVDAIRAALEIGIHSDVEVTLGGWQPPPVVSQVFCSAVPVAYSRVSGKVWAPFAQLVLEAAYEATLWAAVLNARRGASNIVLLTRLGGGVFGNDDDWIDAAMMRALRLARGFDLDVRLVSYGREHPSMRMMAEMFR